MECRSENVTQGPSLTELHFIMSPAGPASRRGLRAIHLGVVGMALWGGHCQCCHLLRSLRLQCGRPSGVMVWQLLPPYFPSSQFLCLTLRPASLSHPMARLFQQALSADTSCVAFYVSRQSLLPRFCVFF